MEEIWVISFSFENKSDLFQVAPDFTPMHSFTLDLGANLDDFLHIWLILYWYSTSCWKHKMC